MDYPKTKNANSNKTREKHENAYMNYPKTKNANSLQENVMILYLIFSELKSLTLCAMG